MNLVVYLEPNYIANESIGKSVTNIDETGKVAIEVALQNQEANGGTVTALIVGETPDEAILREAYAMGIDNLVQVSNKQFDAVNVAEVIKVNGFDAVVTACANASEVAKELAFSVVEGGTLAANTVTLVNGTEAKHRYMHITRVFAAYEQPINHNK